ncbi:Cilia- and flagella-associated protein 58 [Homalodisca vitripennis]|nr:Cilia- and flagella-associated protein 58 [Homalodisca vitripennis]
MAMLQLTNARDIINAQLVRRNDELAMLREKTKTLQSSLDAGENHYSQRLEDIRILKLEIQKLSTEKDVLTRNLTNMADLRTEIHHLEKDMSKERLKARALEEELQNPLNIHRWRKLEGSDPSKYELLHKVKVQQRRILDQATALVEAEQKCVDLERRHAHLDQMLARYQHQQPERERAESCKQRLTQSEKKVKPKEYEEVLGKHGTVHHVGVTILVKDWKSESEKFNPSKRIMLKRNKKKNNNLFQSEVFYRTEGCAAKSVTKPNFDMSHINPKTINKGVGLKSAKVKDVARLLAKHFGEDWRSHEMLKFYRDLVNQEAEGHSNEEDKNIIVDEEIDTKIE